VALSRTSDQIGRVLDGRYRLVAPIGSGASAVVYLADDVRLRRRVAVKVLHPTLADDEQFLRRFQAEAQAAAALNDPHIMAVYDWGRDDTPYLVTEYLGGGSLRAVLDHGDRLTPSQALWVGLQTTRGLEYAHNRGLVHRDIKPANLLFGDDERLRIGDFGLARALAEAGWTEPSGTVLGTLRYASPEQAKGERVGAKSDVYSLGLTLIEAVSGEVPFVGDTPIATLMARVDAHVELDRDQFGPLRPVLERACRPDAADRPDAGELAISFMAAAESLARPTPISLPGAVITGDATVEQRLDLTKVVPDDAEPMPPMLVPSPDPDTATEGATPSKRQQRRAERRAAREAKTATRTRRRRWPWLVALLLLVIAAAVGAAVYAANNVFVTPVHEVEDYTGLFESDVNNLVGAYGWTVEVEEIARPAPRWARCWTRSRRRAPSSRRDPTASSPSSSPGATPMPSCHRGSKAAPATRPSPASRPLVWSSARKPPSTTRRSPPATSSESPTASPSSSSTPSTSSCPPAPTPAPSRRCRSTPATTPWPPRCRAWAWCPSAASRPARRSPRATSSASNRGRVSS
jgi:eukaryotic-like serine/threonine-protein kinase